MTSESAKKPARKTQAAVKKSVSARSPRTAPPPADDAGQALAPILAAVRGRVPRAAQAEALAFVGEFYRLSLIHI